VSTSGTVGTAVGEFVAAGEPSWTLPLQLCNSDTEKSAKEPVSASPFKVVVRMLRLLNGCSLWLRWRCAIWLYQDIGKIRRGRRR
jgi:hypothetical protein